MRVVYYTHPAFFEPALCLVRELSRHVELHVLLEISGTAWRSAAFDIEPLHVPAGLVPADDALGDAVPPGVREYWQEAATFQLVVHPTRRSLHPVSWKISRAALGFAAAIGADVLHIDDVDVSPRLALALPRWRKLPIVISVHDPQPHSGERNWRKDLARRLAFPSARRFVLHNAALRQEFAGRHGLQPHCVETAHLGVYDVLREWSRPSDVEGPTVLFLGRLSPYKGLDVFYEAARLLAQRISGLRFVVAGEPVAGYTPPDPPTLEGRGEIQILQRYLSTAESARLLANTRVVVCPYRDASQSGVVLSAFAFRVPVVATRVGGLPEYVVNGETGLLVPVGDAAAVAGAVGRILLEPALAAQLSRGIAAAANGKLSWRRTSDELRATYAAAIGAGPC